MGLIFLSRSPARSPFNLSLDSTASFRKRQCMPIRTCVLIYIYTTTGTRRHSGETLLLLLLNSVFALPHYGPHTVQGIRYMLPPCPALTHQMYGYGFTAANNYLPLPTTSSFWVRCRPNRSLPYGGTIGSSLSD